MKRPRLRNVPRGSLFSTEITWTNLKSDAEQISSEGSSKHNYQNRLSISQVGAAEPKGTVRYCK